MLAKRILHSVICSQCLESGRDLSEENMIFFFSDRLSFYVHHRDGLR